MSSIDLSSTDVWDDSALITSWNDALDEYTKYHSIFNKVKTEADLERELAAAGLGANGDLVSEDKYDEPMKDDDDEYEPEYVEEKHVSLGLSTEGSANQEPSLKKPEPASESPCIPANMVSNELPMLQHGPLGQVKDETLKKALMGWYYAGYYTGLYEGIQKKEEEAQEAAKNDTQ
ncbi:hypothetical protein BROUX41_005179 [Berkeleyomyces rouxiae]|uniref:uncharacterized protein n=1 Tax=Berkeleyomyces rouxiae TaxID=2035830 RepID=UPI003B7DC94C